MQITKSRGLSRQREFLAYLIIGAFVCLILDFYRGGESFVAYEDYKTVPLTQAAPGTYTLQELNSNVKIAVENALREYKEHEQTRIQAQVEALVKAQSPVSSAATSKGTTPMIDFKTVAHKTGTDKVDGHWRLPECLKNPDLCRQKGYENDVCRIWGHFYDSIYDRWLAPYVEDEPVQLLEIGYYKGMGFEAYTEYLNKNKKAELHSMEISCIEAGPREEGKWPWGNFADKHRWYQRLRNEDRLHCGDASNFEYINKIWTEKMKRPDAPPLKVVIDDAAHLHDHMAISLFYWLPRIEPGGIMIVEDIQPINAANKFRTHILPQVMKDLHWCGGDPKEELLPDSLCFPTIHPLLKGVHCELHICVFQRNDKPAFEPDKAGSLPPKNAFDDNPKCLFGPFE